MKTNYTLETVRTNLQTNQAWVERAIVRLFEKQTTEEQRAEYTKENNGVGFNSFDSKRLSYYAKWISSGKHLSGFHLEKAFKVVPKYAKQIFSLINE